MPALRVISRLPPASEFFRLLHTLPTALSFASPGPGRRTPTPSAAQRRHGTCIPSVFLNVKEKRPCRSSIRISHGSPRPAYWDLHWRLVRRPPSNRLLPLQSPPVRSR